MNVKRTNPPLHLSRTPLIYIVTQVRFSAVVAIEKYVPAIQERLRKAYPWFLHSKIQEIAFQQQGAPSIDFNDRYEFQSRDKKTGVVLTKNSVALHTNKYSSFEKFLEEFYESLSTVHECVGLSLVDRIGLRYVDLVRLRENEGWADYLRPGLLGLDANAVGVQQWTSQFVTTGKTEVGTLAFRYLHSNRALPPDLTPETLNYEELLLKEGEVGAILDFDHYSESSQEFNLEAVIKIIGNLHDNLDRAFRDVVAPEAIKKWE
jgi:uncharacterized protein (TIGR04255 family)